MAEMSRYDSPRGHVRMQGQEQVDKLIHLIGEMLVSDRSSLAMLIAACQLLQTLSIIHMARLISHLQHQKECSHGMLG